MLSNKICFDSLILAANDKLMFWVETLSLVDFLTIPEIFVSVVLGIIS